MPLDHSASTGAAVHAALHPIADLSHSTGNPFTHIDGQVLLRGSQSRSSKSKAFPARETCLETGARDMEELLFGPTGTLYSFSTVHVSATRSVPYLIGYIDFPNGVRVLAQLEGKETDFQCDQPVELRAEGDRWFAIPQTQDLGTKQ